MVREDSREHCPRGETGWGKIGEENMDYTRETAEMWRVYAGANDTG